jgi:hypothetical protein
MQDAVSSSNALAAEAGRSRGGDRLRLAALATLLLGLGAMGDTLFGWTHPPAPGDAALSSAGWEGRRLAAQMLFLKTNAVHHAGIEERAAAAGEEASRAGEFHTHEHHGEDAGAHHDDAHEGGHVLVIPPAQEDFRGPIGHLERAVKPYLAPDGGMYRKDVDQALPYYRLLTWADPHFIQGYTLGSAFICRAGRRVDEALAFLHEGERYNPTSFEIQTDLGRTYAAYRKDYPAAERHLKRALELAPRDRKLSEMEEEALVDAYRWRALNLSKWGKPREAAAVAAEGLMLFSGDRMMLHVIERNGQSPPTPP